MTIGTEDDNNAVLGARVFHKTVVQQFFGILR